MGGPLNTSILMTCRVGGCGLIWLIEPPQGGQPSFLRGRNKMPWIRNSGDYYLLPCARVAFLPLAVVELRNG
jgi:hypothetical protein